MSAGGLESPPSRRCCVPLPWELAEVQAGRQTLARTQGAGQALVPPPAPPPVCFRQVPQCPTRSFEHTGLTPCPQTSLPLSHQSSSFAQGIKGPAENLHVPVFPAAGWGPSTSSGTFTAGRGSGEALPTQPASGGHTGLLPVWRPRTLAGWPLTWQPRDASWARSLLPKWGCCPAGMPTAGRPQVP